MKIGIVSGYFNPLHMGHLEYIHAAKEQVDQLFVIVNSDDQVKLKGSKPFMDEWHRLHIVLALRDVDHAFIAIDGDKTVCESILAVKDECDYTDLGPGWKARDNEYLFFNSGDRAVEGNAETSEIKVCKEYNIKYVAIPLPKIYSSSHLIADSSK